MIFYLNLKIWTWCNLAFFVLLRETGKIPCWWANIASTGAMQVGRFTLLLVEVILRGLKIGWTSSCFSNEDQFTPSNREMLVFCVCYFCFDGLCFSRVALSTRRGRYLPNVGFTYRSAFALCKHEKPTFFIGLRGGRVL